MEVMLFFAGQFTIDTRNAGTGTLLVRVHGLKDSFKVTAEPPVEGEDKRVLHAYYSPRIVATYTIFVRWSGEHVPGSPFNVVINQPQGQSTSQPPEMDTSTDLEVHELADLGDDDDDGYDDGRATNMPSFSEKGKGKGKGKGKMVKSASASSTIVSSGSSSLLHKSSSATMFTASSGNILFGINSFRQNVVSLHIFLKMKGYTCALCLDRYNFQTINATDDRTTPISRWHILFLSLRSSSYATYKRHYLL